MSNHDSQNRVINHLKRGRKDGTRKVSEMYSKLFEQTHLGNTQQGTTAKGLLKCRANSTMLSVAWSGCRPSTSEQLCSCLARGPCVQEFELNSACSKDMIASGLTDKDRVLKTLDDLGLSGV